MGNNRRKRKKVTLGICVSKDEQEQLKQDASKTTCRSFSAYCRKLLLGKPVRVFFRNQSFDAFIDEAIALRKEMESLRGKAFTSATMERLIVLQEEIKKCINKIYDHVSQNKISS